MIKPNAYANKLTGVQGARNKKFIYRDDYRFELRIETFSEYKAKIESPYYYDIMDLERGHLDYFAPADKRSPKYFNGYYKGFLIAGYEEHLLLSIGADSNNSYKYLRLLWKSI